MLIDEAVVIFKGGHGGAGIVSFGKKEGSGPDGGNGGRGGDFYIRASSDITLLNQFSHKTTFQAGDAHHGGKSRSTGKDGLDFDLLLPVGTTIVDFASGKKLLELTKVNERVLFCNGGLGGRGNFEFRSARRTTPKFAQSGRPGELKHVKIILKLIADFGLVGLPNAGKSSLLNEITNAKAKTASYAFTTLSPNLGVIKGKIIADIPGLIEGAAEGKGLGTAFLKHIEKVKVILHCISSQSEDPLKDYMAIRQELGSYKKSLLRKKEIILITKSDLVDKKVAADLAKMFKKKVSNVLVVSIHDWESLEALKELI